MTTDLECLFRALPRGYLRIQTDSPAHIIPLGRTSQILKTTVTSQLSPADAFSLDSEREELFMSWIKVAKRLHSIQPWTEIQALAPIKEIDSADRGARLAVAFHPVEDAHKRLVEVLAELTEVAGSSDRDSARTFGNPGEKENEVKAILSIANTPSDEIAQFIGDSEERVGSIKGILNELKKTFKAERERFETKCPEVPDPVESMYIETLFRHLHTIKGNALTYEFDALASQAHGAESLVGQLRPPLVVRRTDVVASLVRISEQMDVEIQHLRRTHERIYGTEEEKTVRLPEGRVRVITNLCREIMQGTSNPAILTLLEECLRLSWNSLGALTRKYRRAAYTRALRIGKEIEFTVENSEQLFAPAVFRVVDECLLQIVSNAVVHGIEDTQTRQKLAKGPGQLRLSAKKSGSSTIITVSDDGKGIDGELLVKQQISQGALTHSEALGLGWEEKIALLFRSRASTATSVTELAGRGVGMDVVRAKLEQIGGSISVTSRPGQGTTFVLTVPDSLPKDSHAE